MADRTVRLSLFCPGWRPGLNLPFFGPVPGSFDPERWQRTVDHAAAAHRFRSPSLAARP